MDDKIDTDISIYSGEDRVLPADEVLRIHRELKPTGERIYSKIHTLDSTIGGFYPGQLIVVSGVTGHGKTTLCQTFTHNMAEQLTMPLWFSYEVGVEDFLSAFNYDYLPHIYLPLTLKSNSVKWLEDRILEAKAKYNTGVVFIDHIHYLISITPHQNMSFVIGQMVQGIRQLAIKHNMIIFLIAHMTKTKPDEEPGLGMTRDSSFIEQEADVVLYVWRHHKDKFITICKVAKNRKRGIIDEKIALTLKDGKYYEVFFDEDKK